MEQSEKNFAPKPLQNRKRQVILVAMALLLVGVASYSSWRLIISPKLDPTANWQVYRSQECGYQIKHPPDYQFQKTERTEADWRYAPFFAEIVKEDIQVKRDDGKIIFFLSLYSNPLKLSPREWINWANDNDAHLLGAEVESEEEKQSRTEVFKDMVINGVDAIRLDAEFPDQITTTIYLSKEDKLLYILYINRLKNLGDNEKILKAFLDNFKIE